MVMPLPSHMRLPSSATHPRSPVKKHLHQATQHVPVAKPTTKLGSPQKLKATVASQNVISTSVQSTSVAGSTAATTGSGSRLRAATLQAVLGLVDRDDEALQQLLPMLHTLASLPLDDESVRRRCSAALQQLHMTVSCGKEKGSPRIMPVVARRDSGRAKSAVSLKHCKAFLLACANEIHELEEVNPCFDYAEETPSETVVVEPKHAKPTSLKLHLVSRLSAAAFDYASAIDSSSSIRTRGDNLDDDDNDDARADTGSQLSELLLRTVEEEKADRERAVAAVNDCRRVFLAWRAVASRRHHHQPRSRVDTAAMLRAFAALKRNRAASALSRHRKQRAFGRMKQLLWTPHAGPRTVVTTRTTTPSTRTHVLTMMLVHWDLVVLLTIACVVQLARVV